MDSGRPLVDQKSDAAFRDAVLDLVNRSRAGQWRVRRRHKWTAVPVESALHLSADIIRGVADTAQRMAVGHVYAVLVEKIEDQAGTIEFDATVEGLRRFNRECSHFNYVLVPRDLSWILICSTDDFLGIFGPMELVKSVVGKDISVALDEFRSYASGEWWLPETKAMLMSVLEDLSAGYPSAQVGEFVSFPSSLG